jgi:transposase-like protein
MSDAVGLSTDRRVRRFRSISEKLQIVQLTLKPGASVAQVAQAHGVNANQVFKWRRAFDRGELSEPECCAGAGHGGQPTRREQRDRRSYEADGRRDPHRASWSGDDQRRERR